MAISFDLSETFELSAGKVRVTFRHPSYRETAKIERLQAAVYAAQEKAKAAAEAGDAEAQELANGELLEAMHGVLAVTATDLKSAYTAPVVIKLFNSFLERTQIDERTLGESSSPASSGPV
jgi:hypothetical protein